jgi:hypothetical protein
MDFREIVAEHEAALIGAACRAEGFDATLTGRIIAWHRDHAASLDLAEHYGDGVRHHVRSIAAMLSRPA